MVKKIWIIIFLAVAIVIVFIIIHSSKNIGSNLSELIETSLTMQYSEQKQVEIVDTYSIYNYEIVGFKHVNEYKYGIALFEKYKDKYKLLKIIRHEKLGERAMDIFIEYINLFDESNTPVTCLIALSLNDKLSKVKITINNRESTFKEVNFKPSIVKLFEFSKNQYNGELNVEYLFLDKDNNVIQ